MNLAEQNFTGQFSRSQVVVSPVKMLKLTNPQKMGSGSGEEDSIQFFISIHTEQYNFLQFIQLSMSSIILQKINVCFHQIIHDVFINMHVL